MLCLYRSNFTFPVLISPKVEFADDLEPFLGEFWIPEVLVSRNQEILQRRLKRGSFLLFMSDGFMESSRDMKQFIGYLRIQLASKGTNVTVASITELVLRYEQFVVNRTNDDRTLMAFQWTLDRRRLSMDNDELQKIVVNS
jgi:hypothetical protein